MPFNKYMDSPKIGAWAHGMDFLLLEEIKKYDFIYYFVLSGSMLEGYLNKNLADSNIIPIRQTSGSEAPSVTFAEMIDNTDFTEVLKKEGIRNFILPHSVSPLYEKWAKKNSVQLIEPPFEIANIFEDKIKFNQFLSKHRIPSPSSYSPEQIMSLPDSEKKAFVFQETNNFGLYGTRFFPAVKAAKKYLSSLQTSKDLLIREFLSGPAFGTTLFLDKQGSHFYSSLRKQCYELDKNGFPQKCLGIQWVPDDFFDDNFHKNINVSLDSLAKVFKSSDYYGTASLDFVVHGNNAYFLECNARLSSASAQLFGLTELTGGINSWDFFINSFTNKNNIPINKSEIPHSNFSGSAFDIYKEEEIHLKKIPSVGTYVLKGKHIEYLGEFADIKSENEKRLFAAHDFDQKEQNQKDLILCSLFTNFPVFDFISGELNEDGKFIEKFFWNYAMN